MSGIDSGGSKYDGMGRKKEEFEKGTPLNASKPRPPNVDLFFLFLLGLDTFTHK